MNTTLTISPPDRHAGPDRDTAPRRVAPRISPFGPADFAPTSDFEAAFRRRLTELAGAPATGPSRPRRTTITAVVTALRSGVEVDQVLAVARGLTAAELSEAYDFVDGLRQEATDAFDVLVDEPTIVRFSEVETRLALLLPHPSATLRSIADERPRVFASAVADAAKRVVLLDRAADEIEGRLARHDQDWSQLVTELDDGRNRGVYHQPNYRPRRVGDVMPLRLASLLGESEREENR